MHHFIVIVHPGGWTERRGPFASARDRDLVASRLARELPADARVLRLDAADPSPAVVEVPRAR